MLNYRHKKILGKFVITLSLLLISTTTFAASEIPSNTSLEGEALALETNSESLNMTSEVLNSESSEPVEENVLENYDNAEMLGNKLNSYDYSAVYEEQKNEK